VRVNERPELHQIGAPRDDELVHARSVEIDEHDVDGELEAGLREHVGDVPLPQAPRCDGISPFEHRFDAAGGELHPGEQGIDLEDRLLHLPGQMGIQFRLDRPQAA